MRGGLKSMRESGGEESREGGAVARQALLFTVAEREDAFATFFGAHPGTSRAGPGLGQALCDFLAWEVASGRVTDSGGSLWWKVMNGCLTSDLLAASRPGSDLLGAGPGEGPEAWHRYADAPPGEQQRMLWLAHDASIGAALAVASPFLVREEEDEKSFVRLVLGVLADTARICAPTDSPALGRSVHRLYPKSYPVAPAEFEALETGLAAMAQSAPNSS